MCFDEDYDLDHDSPDNGIRVPTLPSRKQPSNIPMILYASRPSQVGSSTQDCSTNKSLSLELNILDTQQMIGTHDKYIMSIMNSFKNASGIARRELECKIIRMLTSQKKTLEHQDQYVIAMSWVKQYTSYLYENELFKPSKIDNQCLFEDIQKRVFKKNLAQHKDFVVVNEIVWTFLKQEYQGGPEIIYEKYQQVARKSLNFLQPDVPTRQSTRPSSVEPTYTSISIKQHQQVNYEIPIVGFKNDLYFCYMNSGLQSLLSLPDLNYFFLKVMKLTYRESLPKKMLQSQLPFCLAYYDLIDHVRHNETKEHIKVNNIRYLLQKKFNPRQQHDCQEFVLYLLSSIEEEINVLFKDLRRINQNLKIPEINIIQQLFKGSIESKVVCNNKGCQPTIVSEPFITLSLALKQKTLEGCLEEFFKDEKIKDHKCEKCKQVGTLKKTYLGSQPKYLIFHVKRFKFFPKQHKISQQLVFPLEGLSLKKYLYSKQTEVIYKLRALVVHQGSLDSGHYFCFGRRFHQWFQFNDQSVKRVNKKDLLNQQAYLLFYSQQNE